MWYRLRNIMLLLFNLTYTSMYLYTIYLYIYYTVYVGVSCLLLTFYLLTTSQSLWLTDMKENRNRVVSLAAELYRECQFSPVIQCYSLWRTRSNVLEQQKCKLISETTTLFCLARKKLHIWKCWGLFVFSAVFHFLLFSFFDSSPWRDLLTS